MRILIILVSIFIATIFSCSSHQSVFISNDRVPYTVEEFNIMVAATYFKHVKKDCKDTCRYLINSDLSFFNPNFLRCEGYKEKFNKAGYDKMKTVNISSLNFPIEGVGNLIFADFKDANLTSFAPAIYFPDQKYIIGQVKEQDGKYIIFTCMLLGDKIFWSDNGDFFDCFNFPKEISSKSSTKILDND